MVMFMLMDMFPIPFISQSAADSTRRQLQDLSSKIGASLQPVFMRKKIGEIIKAREPKPKIINEQCIVYQFKWSLCEMDYVGFYGVISPPKFEFHFRCSAHILCLLSVIRH